MRAPAASPAALRRPRRDGAFRADVAAFFQLFAATPRVVTLYSQGVNQSAQGTDKVNAIVNCHLATARIGKLGAAPFSLTGQPNAMGGREVGGLANQLAAHMNFTPPDIDRVRRFWKAPRIATHEGLKAVEMFEAIGRGEIKALWVMGTNPAVSLPDADAARGRVEEARTVRDLRNVSPTTPSVPARMCCCRRWPGARSPALSPIRSGASRVSALSCRRPERRRQTGGSSARSPNASVSGGVRLRLGGGDLPRACGAVGFRE